MIVTVPLFERRTPGSGLWVTTVGLGPETVEAGGGGPTKVRQKITDRLKRRITELEPRDLERFELSRGLRLERLRLTIELPVPGGKRRLSGLFPLILEPRWLSSDRRIDVAYHPLRQDEWFPVRADEPLADLAAAWFRQTWTGLAEWETDVLLADSRDRLRMVAFVARPPSLLDQLPDRAGDIWDDLDPARRRDQGAKRKVRRPGGMRVLKDIATNLTLRAVEGRLAGGTPRTPYREQLQRLLGPGSKCPVLIVGPPGCGKTTLLYRWIADLLDADGYRTHQNLDRVHHVWSVTGQRIIAGMQHLGDWEQRCVELCADAASPRVVLHVEDIAAWGRIGQTRDSDRSLATFFRGPLARGELVMVGECSPEALQRLEEDAASFVSLFTILRVEPATADETLHLLVRQARSIERETGGALDPMLHRAILDLGAGLSSGALPGAALDLLNELGRAAAGPGKTTGRDELAALLADKTGLPEALLDPSREAGTFDPERALSRSVVGQPRAIRAAADLLERVRAGLTDAARPWGVYLFTGPTGTGKTELAKQLATLLYAGQQRLLRLDMAELSAPDAAGRLIGDRWDPDGLLTRPILDQPFQLVLLDEIEKAHRSVLHLLLQLFDEGRLTDAAGRTADFRHTVVVMTSNLGARARSPVGFGSQQEQALQLGITRAVQDFFPPELFNRIDRVVPFASLSREAARQIAEIQLRRLLTRPGITDRNVFVYYGQQVLDRVVSDGFDPTLGARTVKRWLERHVADRLAEELAARPAAAMQAFRLYDTPDGLRIHAEPLVEAELRDEPLALEPLLKRPVSELQEELPTAMDRLDTLRAEAGREVGRRIHDHMGREGKTAVADPDDAGWAERAEAVYHLETLRGALRGLRGRLGRLLGRRRAAGRDDILACLAELRFLERTCQVVEDVRRHTVFMEVLRLPTGRDEGDVRADAGTLLDELIAAYRNGQGEVEAFAQTDGDAIVEEPRVRHPEVAVLKLSGLNLLDVYEGETGCHVFESLAGGTAVVRVRVWSAEPDRTPRQVIEDHRAGVRAFEQALRTGAQPLPENPQRLLPVVRRYRFDPPRPGALAPVEVEDFSLGHVDQTTARRLRDALPRLLLLRMSREVER